ncbi:FecR family protein [Prevotella sp.]|uniref:FecR family protein n=1 Tax=Prevotella sp. TaxID=59823 RepID=UPI002F9451F4
MAYIDRIIHFFFHHEAPSDLRERVHRRLLAHEESADEALQSVWNEQPAASADPNHTDEALRRVEEKLFGPMPRRRPEGIRWLIRAAVWLVPVVLLAASAYLYMGSRDNLKLLADTQLIEHATANGEHRQLMLPDGTAVWLNAGSVIIYPSTFRGTERKVYLSGEAFFKVSHDEDHPFIVNTRQANLKVLGTEFNVMSYPEMDRMIITLQQGKLGVDISSSGRNYILTPNQQLIYTPATDSVELHSVTATNYSSWKQGELFFSDARLTTVLRAIERTYNVRCHLVNSRYANQRVRLHLDRDEKLSTVLHVLRDLLPGLNYTIEGKDVYIR